MDYTPGLFTFSSHPGRTNAIKSDRDREKYRMIKLYFTRVHGLHARGGGGGGLFTSSPHLGRSDARRSYAIIPPL